MEANDVSIVTSEMWFPYQHICAEQKAQNKMLPLTHSKASLSYIMFLVEKTKPPAPTAPYQIVCAPVHTSTQWELSWDP